MVHAFGDIGVQPLQRKILSHAMKANCEAVRKATKGVIDRDIDEETFELMFIHTFLPYWNKETVKKAKCYIDEKFNIR